MRFSTLTDAERPLQLQWVERAEQFSSGRAGETRAAEDWRSALS